MRSCLIIGTEGLVGSSRFGFDNGRVIVTPKEAELDITAREAVRNYIDAHRPDSIVLLAAYTDVDGAEKNRDLAWKVNVEGVENVAAAARGVGAFLIYISTDFVFPGTPDFPGPYPEDAIPPEESEARGWYGQTKFEGEKVIKNLEGQSGARVRISFPFGNVSSPKDYLRKIIDGLNKGYPLFADQQITPTFIRDLWLALDKIERERKSDTWHVATKPTTTPYELAVYLNEQLGLGKTLSKGSVVEYMQKNQVAPRPVLGGLKTEKTGKELGLTFKTWQEAIDEIIPELKTVSSQDY